MNSAVMGYERLSVEFHTVRDMPGRKGSYVTMVHALYQGREYVLLTLFSVSAATGMDLPTETDIIERTPDVGS